MKENFCDKCGNILNKNNKCDKCDKKTKKTRLNKSEIKFMKEELIIIGRDDLLTHFDNLGHAYFIDRVFELYDLVYEMGKNGDSIYNLTSILNRHRDLLLKWREYDVELVNMYRMGQRARKTELLKLLDELNQYKATKLIKTRNSETGLLELNSVISEREKVEKSLDRIDIKIYGSTGSSDLEDIIDDILSSEDEGNTYE